MPWDLCCVRTTGIPQRAAPVNNAPSSFLGCFFFPFLFQFDPDRFGSEREEHKQPFAYLGFGAGMHQCMGQQFAFVQVRYKHTHTHTHTKKGSQAVDNTESYIIAYSHVRS